MTRKLLFTVLFAVSASLFLTVQASAQERPIVPADEFLSAFADLRADLEDGMPRELSNREWREFNRIEQRFEFLLSNVDDATQLPSRQQLEIYNLQNELDGMIMGGIRDQRVCTEQRSVGSRIARRNCRTVAEIEEERIRARDWLQRFPFQMEGPQG